MQKKRKKVEMLQLIKVCPGGRHAWYHSNVGVIRKPCTKAAR